MHHRHPLLSALDVAIRRPLRRGRAGALAHREPPPLGPRCGHGRGPGACPQGSRPGNLARFRRFALNLLRVNPDKGSTRSKVKRPGWDDDFLLNILSAA
jgi:hypothetical protein